MTSIYNYISNSLSNKQAADSLLVKVLEKFKMIQIFPKSAPLVNNEYVKNKLLRKLIIENYIAFYEVNEENREVRIIRII